MNSGPFTKFYDKIELKIIIEKYTFIFVPRKHHSILEYAHFWTSTNLFPKQLNLNLLQTAI